MAAITKPSPVPSPAGQSGFELPPARNPTRRSSDRTDRTPAWRAMNPSYYESPQSVRSIDPSNPFLPGSQKAAAKATSGVQDGNGLDFGKETNVHDVQAEPYAGRASVSNDNDVHGHAFAPHVLRGTYPPSSMARQMHRIPSNNTTTINHRESFDTPTKPPTLGRGMSFYDMKQQRKLGEMVHGGPNKRAAWTSMDGQYDDGISHAFPTYEPPHMGQPPARPKSIRGGLPWIMWMNSSVKNHFVATLGEFVGTTMFLFFAFAGTQVANVNTTTTGNTTTNASTGFNPEKLSYIALSFGFSLTVNVWIFFRISGGLFNPAVTLALLLTGAIGCLRAVALFFAQIAGSIAASALVIGLFPAKFNVQTTLSDETSLAHGIFIEAFLTAELVFTILMLAKEKHRSTFIAPVGIGLALFIAELVGVYYTGGSLNPARSLGPAIVGNTWDGNQWVYWVGPFIGVLIAVGFYKFIKLLEYEMANPGQDADENNDPTKNPYHEVREKQRDTTARVLKSLGLEEAALTPQYPQHSQWSPAQHMQHNVYEPMPRPSGAGYSRPATANGNAHAVQEAKEHWHPSNGKQYENENEQAEMSIPNKATMG